VNLAELYALVKRFEGCKLTPYLCPAGIWTCGWGSTGPDVFPGRRWTQEYADYRLELDAVRFSRAVAILCPGLAESPHNAISDFAYNLGEDRLKNSTLRRKVNAQAWQAARRELRKWVNGGGRRLPGLVLRREVEASMLPA
jgi:lysozyme